MGKIPRWWEEGKWEYPTLGGMMIEDGIKVIDIYISMRKNTVVQYISNRSILYLCLDKVRSLVLWASKW